MRLPATQNRTRSLLPTFTTRRAAAFWIILTKALAQADTKDGGDAAMEFANQYCSRKNPARLVIGMV